MSKNKLGAYIQKLMTVVLDNEEEQFVQDLAYSELNRLNTDVSEFLLKNREDDKEDVLLVEEKGYNVYRKVADEKCKAAKNWWATNKDFWSRVRNKWSAVYGRDKDLALEKAVNGQALFMQLFPMDIETEQSKIGSTVEEYVKK